MTEHHLDRLNQEGQHSAGVQFLVDLGMEPAEAFAFEEGLAAQRPDPDWTTSMRVASRVRQMELRLWFLRRIGLDVRSATGINRPGDLAAAADLYRSAGFTCASSILHLLNAHATPELAVLVMKAGSSRGDAPHYIEVSRAVLPKQTAVVGPQAGPAAAWLAIFEQENAILEAWFGSGIPAHWVPRYLAACVGLSEALDVFEPLRLVDEKDVLDTVEMLIGLKGSLVA